MSTYTFTEINSILSASSGECKGKGVYNCSCLSEQLNWDSKNIGVYVAQHLKLRIKCVVGSKVQSRESDNSVKLIPALKPL